MAMSTVRLTTTQCSSPVSVHLFQFGTVPASPGTYSMLVDSVAPGAGGEPVFSLDRDAAVAVNQEVRFNLRFELNVHNSANLQLCLCPSGSSTLLQWRWSAPIGFTGTWSAGEQQAPWFDDQMDYCITIEPEGADVSVTLSEHPAIAGQQPAFIPAVQGFEGMVRPR
jgi:hypothetical protein